MQIHPTAIVSDGARLGADVEVGPGAIIGPEARLGDRVRIGARVILEGSIEIGADTRVWPGAILGHEPQDRSFDGSPSSVSIGERCHIRELVTIHRASLPGGVTRIGNDVTLMTSAHVAHDCTIGDHAILAGGVLLAGHVQVGPQAFLSGNVVVHQFVRIGRLAMIGGASAVSHDMLPFALGAGRNSVRGLNTVGLRRSDIGTAGASELRELYRILRAAAPNLASALDDVRAKASSPASQDLIEFIAAPTKRGYAQFA